MTVVRGYVWLRHDSSVESTRQPPMGVLLAADSASPEACVVYSAAACARRTTGSDNTMITGRSERAVISASVWKSNTARSACPGFAGDVPRFRPTDPDPCYADASSPPSGLTAIRSETVCWRLKVRLPVDITQGDIMRHAGRYVWSGTRHSAHSVPGRHIFFAASTSGAHQDAPSHLSSCEV